MPARSSLPARRPSPRQVVVVLALIGLAARAIRLTGPPLQWDEGWSVALAALPAAEMLDLTARDVHPPLYYALLAPWLGALGPSPWAARALSVLAGGAAVPLAAAAAAAWWSGRRRARAMIAAAAFAALAPPLVYYGGIARMYAATAPLLLLAAYGVGRAARAPDAPSAADAARRRPARAGSLGAAVAGSAGALLTFYYSGFALAGLGAGALVLRPRGWRALLVWAAATAAAVAPWLAYALPRLTERIAARTGGRFDLARMPDGMLAALEGAVAVDADARPALVALAIAGGAALALGRDRRGALVAALPVGAVLAGAAAGSQAHMLAPRYAIVATPFLALGAAWIAVSLAGRGRAATALGLAALAAGVAPTLAGAAHARSAEVDAPYDAAALPAAIVAVAGPEDLVVFNLLSLAGAYRALRPPDGPPWTYAQLWDPVHESPERAIGRLLERLGTGSPAAAASGVVVQPSRASPEPPAAVWLALYRGLAADDTAALARWAHWTLWPIGERWAGDVLLRGFVDAAPDRSMPPSRGPSDERLFGASVRLVAAKHTGAVRPGRGIAVRLEWTPTRPIAADLRVFVHAYGPDGALVAQHDGVPEAGERPAPSWGAGERIVDRHGLLVPAGAPAELALAVGLYDGASGARLALPDGSDMLLIGRVRVGEP